MSSIDGRELRDAFGQFATGVCLVTTTDDSLTPVAVTINSFSSVSLEPPLVLWSLQNDSDVYGIFACARHFAISMLSRNQMEHSIKYALKDNHTIASSHFHPGDNGAPLISDALVSFECELEATYDGGDHLIIIGRVTRLEKGSDNEPLVFFGGQYRELVKK